MSKITYKDHLQKSFKNENVNLQDIYKKFIQLNIDGYALICEGRCAMSIEDNELNGLKISNVNGVIMIEPLENNNITVNGTNRNIHRAFQTF